jgi:hypothetical protein
MGITSSKILLGFLIKFFRRRASNASKASQKSRISQKSQKSRMSQKSQKSQASQHSQTTDGHPKPGQGIRKFKNELESRISQQFQDIGEKITFYNENLETIGLNSTEHELADNLGTREVSKQNDLIDQLPEETERIPIIVGDIFITGSTTEDFGAFATGKNYNTSAPDYELDHGENYETILCDDSEAPCERQPVNFEKRKKSNRVFESQRISALEEDSGDSQTDQKIEDRISKLEIVVDQIYQQELDKEKKIEGYSQKLDSIEGLLKRLMGALPEVSPEQKFSAANIVVENEGTTEQRLFSNGESRLRKILARRGSDNEMNGKNCMELARDNNEISKRALTDGLDREYFGQEVSFNGGLRKSSRGSGGKENLDSS